MKPQELPLRDIHLPAPVPWWPLAPGWWLCIAALLLLAVAIAWWWRDAPNRRARRAALAEMTRIEDAYARSADGHACAQSLSRLLRQVALLAGGSHAAASRGEDLTALLAGLAKTPLPEDVVALLRDAPYSPGAAAAIDAERYRHVMTALRAWLTRLRVPRQRLVSLRHAAV